MSKFLSSQQISEAAQAAINNWDFDQVDDGEKQKLALEHLVKNPPADGIEISHSFRDEWDWLAEYATNTAGDMSEEFLAYAKNYGWS
jgi:hypothetical protein